MKNIAKILFVAISSLSLMLSAKAGELSVSGSAKATYNASSGAQQDNGIGVTNELNFTASGELDNGYTWSYSMELDPSTDDSGAARNDDTQVSLGMGDLGTLKVCVSECGNNKKYAWDQSAYTSMSDTGISEGITYPDDMGSYASIQYHTPELPLGITASIAHGNQKTDGQSGNQTATSGDSATEYSVVMKPVDGLTLSGSYMEKNTYGDGTDHDQNEENGAYAVAYSAGNISVGYGKSFKAPEATAITAGATTAEYHENTGMSLAYAINDQVSVSYTEETAEKNMQTSSTTTYDIEMQSVQVAYSLGGGTLSLARADYENYNHVQNHDATETIIALAFAF